MKTFLRHRLLVGTASLTLVAGITYSCKDFLDTAAQGILDEPTLTTRSGVEGRLIAAYRTLDCTTFTNANWGCAASNWVWGSVTSDDAYKGSEASDQPGVTDIELYNWSTGEAQAYLNTKWRAVYEGIVRSNSTIRLLRTVQQQNPGEIPDADARSIEGEAIFLRAHYHFEAWRMWQNIPYYREDDTDIRKSNVGVNVAAELLSDLDSAIALLPETPRNGQVGRATAWTARAYKGRVQVYAAQSNPAMWDSALVTLRDVRTNGPYDLQPSYDQVWTGFAQYANGPETILAFQASVNDGEPNGDNGNWGERLNFPHSGSTLETCCGFHQPSQNLVNFFVVDSITGLPLALTDATWNARGTNLDAVASSNLSVDPRLDWTVGRDSVPYKDWGRQVSEPEDWIRQRAYGGPYSPKKNVQEISSGAQSNVGWLPAQLNSVRMHIFRYADMLLLLAEAEVEATTGVLENARTIVNEIRARAGQTAQGCGRGSSDSLLVVEYPTCANDDRIAVPLVQGALFDSLAAPWARYKVGVYTAPFADQATARQAVRYERRLELAMEGQRFFDLRRWGDADTVIANYLAVEETRRLYLGGAAPFQPRHRLYPLPTLQIELSRVGGEDRLVQNPDW